MKKKRASWIFVFLFVIGLIALQGQTMLNVKVKSGTQASFVLNKIAKLVFNSGIMTATMKDANSWAFTLQNIQNLNFVNPTSLSKVQDASTGEMMLYPNPVKNRLQIRYESKGEESVLIQLIDIQGRVLFQQYLKSIAGTNELEVSIDTFRNGLYLCRLQRDNTTEINKFIKY